MDVSAIKQVAAECWPEILTDLGGIDAKLLDGRHHPCPKCGGKDRCRFIDADAGAMFCNQCFDKDNCDGIAALMWLQGWDFSTTLEKLANHLRIKPKKKRTARKPDPIRRIKNRRLPADCTDLVKQFCEAKPPIAPEAVAKYCGIGGFLSHACLVFQGQNLKGVGTGVLVMRADGEPFPAFGNLSERKTHNVGGSTEGWIAGKVDDLPGNVAAMKAADWVVKTEGPGDLLAIVSTEMPDGWIAVSNLCGAKSASKLAFGWAKGKDVVIVADADEPGIEGAKRFAAEFLKAGAASVRIVELPYEVTPNQGKDLRDYFAEGHSFDDFQKLVDAAEPVTAEEAAKWVGKSSARTVGPRDGRPTIKLDIDEPRILTEAVDALGKQTAIYQRGPTLVQIVKNAPAPRGLDRPPDGPRIAPAADARLKEILTAAANWEVEAGEDVDYKPCPSWVVRGVVAHGEWPGVRRLESIVEAPTLRADGSVVQEPGYDEATGLFFSPQVDFPPVLESPTLDDAIQARDDLLEVILIFLWPTTRTARLGSPECWRFLLGLHSMGRVR